MGWSKSAFLWNLLELSYTMECEPEEWEGIQLERYISHEKNPELKEALKDLNDFLPRDGILREGMYGSDSVVFLPTLLSGEFEGVSQKIYHKISE